MSYDPKIWSQHIAECLELFSNTAIHRCRWANENGTPNGEFDEDVNRLFDDINFHEFVTENPLRLTAHLEASISEFENEFSSFLDSLPDPLDDLSFINTAKWKSHCHRVIR